MSALAPKADMCSALANVRYAPEPDIQLERHTPTLPIANSMSPHRSDNIEPSSLWSTRQIVSDTQGGRGVAGGCPMDIEPVVHALPAPRRFPELLSKIDAGDLALDQVANKRGVESYP